MDEKNPESAEERQDNFCFYCKITPSIIIVTGIIKNLNKKEHSHPIPMYLCECSGLARHVANNTMHTQQ